MSSDRLVFETILMGKKCFLVLKKFFLSSCRSVEKKILATSRIKNPKMSQKSVLIAITIAIVLTMMVEAEAKRKSERT
jgi:hypothetical protein